MLAALLEVTVKLAERVVHIAVVDSVSRCLQDRLVLLGDADGRQRRPRRARVRGGHSRRVGESVEIDADAGQVDEKGDEHLIHMHGGMWPQTGLNTYSTLRRSGQSGQSTCQRFMQSNHDRNSVQRYQSRTFTLLNDDQHVVPAKIRPPMVVVCRDEQRNRPVKSVGQRQTVLIFGKGERRQVVKFKMAELKWQNVPNGKNCRRCDSVHMPAGSREVG